VVLKYGKLFAKVVVEWKGVDGAKADKIWLVSKEEA